MASPMSPKAFPVSWDQFHRDARALAWRLADAGPFEAIVCITRGGLVPARVLPVGGQADPHVNSGPAVGVLGAPAQRGGHVVIHA